MADNRKKREDIGKWVELSDYDLKTAEAMQKAGRYLYGCGAKIAARKTYRLLH